MSQVNQAVRRALFQRGHSGMRLGLERSLAAAAALGHPERELRAFHVAGSNGKGSTSAMLERVYREAGWVTGLYTSPHLCKLSERVRVRGEPISDEALDDALARVLRDAPGELTFFETLTMAAFVALASARVEIAILEVGLGGRLDATNLIEQPLAAAIVSITEGQDGRYLEHADFLGDDVGTIAKEKAGILKRGTPCVLGPVSPVARSAILQVAEERGAAPIVEPVVERRGAVAEVRLPGGDVIALRPRLRGPHQLTNASIAATMAALAPAALRPTPKHIQRGIELAFWAGRQESIQHDGRCWLLDAAHNLDGVRTLVASQVELGWEPARTTLLFGALADKPYREMLSLLAPFAARFVFGPPGGRAPAPLHELAAIAPGAQASSAEHACELAAAVTPRGDTVLVTGSIYFIGAVRARLLGIEPDPVIAL